MECIKKKEEVKILISAISGAHGFIGSHLYKALLSKGQKVIAIPRNLLKNQLKLKEFFEKEKPDYIFHLAAFGNMSHQKEEQEIFEANVIGTWNMLMASKDIDYKGFINFGSSSEYGMKFKSMSELDSLDTDTFYGASKGSATLLARAVASQFDKPIVTVRPFSVYGPGEADYRFIPTICRSIIKGEPMKVYTYPRHDWIYIEDFIDDVIAVMDLGSNLKGEAVNIGSGKSTENLKLVEIFQKISGAKANIVGVIQGINFKWQSAGSVLKEYNLNPKRHTLEEGLKKTWKYYNKKYEK